MRECRKRLPLCFGIWCHLLARASTNQNTHSEVACPDLRYPPNVRAQPISVTSLAHTVRWTFRLLCCSKVTARVNDWNLSAVLSYKPILQHTFAGIANHAVLFIYKPKLVVTFNLSNFHAVGTSDLFISMRHSCFAKSRVKAFTENAHGAYWWVFSNCFFHITMHAPRCCIDFFARQKATFFLTLIHVCLFIANITCHAVGNDLILIAVRISLILWQRVSVEFPQMWSCQWWLIFEFYRVAGFSELHDEL